MQADLQSTKTVLRLRLLLCRHYCSAGSGYADHDIIFTFFRPYSRVSEHRGILKINEVNRELGFFFRLGEASSCSLGREGSEN